MVSPIFFLLFATVFSAVVPGVKRPSDTLETILGALSKVDESVTRASGALSYLSPKDRNSVRAFENSFTNIVDTINTVSPSIQRAVLNQPPLSPEQDQQLGVQAVRLQTDTINLIQSILGKKNVINRSGLTRFVQSTAGDLKTAATVLDAPVIVVFPQHDVAADNLNSVLGNLTLLQGIEGQSCN